MRTARTVLIGTAIAALLATGCEWRFETLDGAGGPNGRTTNDVGLDNATVLYNGRPHVFYLDESDDTLRHGYFNGSFWSFETLDGDGGPDGRIDNALGFDSAVVLYNGRPHVFYYNLNEGTLRHAYWNGVFWAFETLDGNGGPNGRTMNNVGDGTSVVLYDGRPHVFYYDNDDKDLRHAYYTGAAWGFETLDGAGGANGRVNADLGDYPAAVLYNGRPHAFYQNSSDGSLRHAYWNGFFWAFETLDGNGGPNGRTTNDVGAYNAVVLYNGRPHVFYEDGTFGDLRHAYWNGFFWAFETLDGHVNGANGRISAPLGSHVAVVIYNGRPDVFYYASGMRTNLRHAYYNGSAWGFETLDGHQNGPNGRINASLGQDNAALVYSGRPDVFYYDETNGDLRHAYFG